MIDIDAVLDQVTYKDWELRRGRTDGVRWIQWRFWAVDNTGQSPTPELQSCRKWMLSQFMTKSEVVRTCYLAAQQAELHECAENFKLNGAMLFNPHADLFHLEVAINNGLIGDDYR